MPVQTMSLTEPSLTSSWHNNVVLPSRTFHIPRIKISPTTLLRHAYLSPSGQQIAELKHHNSLCLACTLPEEVTRKILLACAQLGVGESDEWSWVSVTYVCSAWRKMAIEYQDLWRYIDFSHPKWHAITTGRAKMWALHIKTTVSDTNIRLLHRTLQLAHRIQDIHLTSPIQKIYPLLEILAHPNPALESLIVGVHIPKTQSFIDAYDPPCFPPNGPPLTNLKYMELRAAPFYLLTSRCIFLMHLHLHDLPLTERPTRQYFLLMLKHLTRLEYLTLDRSFPISTGLDDVQALERRISLPQLKNMSLVGSIPEVAIMLECIMIPPSAHLSVRICALSGLKASIWKLTEVLSSHSSTSASVLPLETLVLTGHEASPRFTDDFKPNANFRQSLRIRGFRAECGGGGAAIDLTIAPDEQEHNHNDDAMITALTAIWKALALSQIHTLALQDMDIVTHKSWSQFLRTLPALRVVDVAGRAPSGLAWALLLNARSHDQLLKGEDGEQRLLVSRLQDVYLHKVDCSSGGFMVVPTAPVHSHFDLGDSRFLDVLTASLCERRRFRLGLRSLSIAHCEFVLRKSLEDARMAVAYLVCDLRNILKDELVDEANPSHQRNEYSMLGSAAIRCSSQLG
ncbi:hypothetical protein NLJ89_g4190 [Agrocybe chaxingu]|uniref:F-box domain-containing protein n=1 Tax=Agrocybe chaxingu TaxID=84603 RepID=A0A9W8MUS5_9AGAR|nr:hypothetical protein NLJ89_g4190 [Agrocybe chaxingu]